MKRSELLRKIQEVHFVLYDVSLFLDTHPNNKMALDFFKQYQKIYTELEAEYVINFGPLTAMDTDTSKGWMWAKTPWPWEMEG